MKKIALLSLALILAVIGAAAQDLTAAFAASEAMTPYYEQGWDSQEEFDTWTYSQQSSSTWKLGTRAKDFSSIDKTSKSSMILNYASSQNEVATSPEITIRSGSELEFYCYASGIFLVYGSWKLYAIADGQQTLLIDQFLWAQDKGYDGPSWERFTVDLAPYAGKKVKFSFVYQGNQGEDEAIDGFKIKQANLGDDAVVNIKEGESVHFLDMSQGDVSSWSWTFSGGTPSMSTEQNPVITYDKAGTYDVSLTVSDGSGTATATRTGFVVVQGEAPIAHIGLPQGAYLSPWVMMFVPTDVPLTFPDESTGNPTSWLWTFQGTDVTTSTDQNPTVTYTQAGTYGIRLEVANDMGSSVDEAVSTAIQAGGEQEVWNIAPEENGDLDWIQLGWYGYYGGTNWLGMGEFAEHYDAPIADAAIEKVNVYFASITAADPNDEIAVKIMTPGEDGAPANVLAATSLKTSELKYDSKTVNATEFTLERPIRIKAGTDFFVVIGPFPNNDDDDLAVLAHRRGAGEKCTTWHFAYDEGDNYEYLDTGAWYQNTDDPVSLAMAPILNYELAKTGITTLDSGNKQVAGVAYYNLAGIRSDKPFTGVNIVVTTYTDGTRTAEKMLK